MITRIENYKNFGRVLFAQGKALTLGFTLDIGPRIIYLAGADGENMFFEDADRKTGKVGKEMENFFGEGLGWCLYGGHRVWLSPEKFPDTYHPDCTPVKYSVNECSVTVSTETHATGLETEITASFVSDGTVSVTNRIYNRSHQDIKGSVWALSVMDGGGIAAVRQNVADTGLLNNRVIAVWPYTDLRDSRLYIGDKFISVKQSNDCKCPLKIAVNDTHGMAVYFNKGKMFEKRYATDFSMPYPDGGVSCEIYTNEDFLELESLSPVKTVHPGSYLEHIELWRLHDGVSAPIQNDDILISIFDNY